MFLAAARAIAEMSPAKLDPQANLLAPLRDIRKLTFHVALAVAKQAQAENLAAPMSDEVIATTIAAKMWEPLYATYHRLRGAVEA
jgi:malate dehydrogenase (oxaloacetate-decarboxylating)